MENARIRKIKSSEINRCAEIMAECFKDYPLYPIFFPDENSRVKMLTKFYTVSLRARRDYTYVTDDFSFVGCIKRPTDKKHSLVLSFLHPKCFFKCLSALKRKYLKLMNEYEDVMRKMRDTYCNPEKTVYVEAICIRADARKELSFFDLFKENYNNETLYAETADERLAKLYRILGFEEKTNVAWRGIINRAIVKESKNTEEKN